MPADITTALIAAGSAVGGGLVVAGSNYVVYRAQARHDGKDRLRAALEAFQFVVYRVELLLRREPKKPGPIAGAIGAAIERFSPWLSAKLALLSQRIFEPQVEALSDEIARAMATTILIAPPATRPALQAISTLMAQANGRDDAWWAEWDAARDRLVVVFLEALAVPNGKPGGLPTSSPPTSPQTQVGV